MRVCSKTFLACIKSVAHCDTLFYFYGMDRYFKDSVGFDACSRLCVDDWKSTLQVLKAEKYYTMAAAAAVIKFAEHKGKMVLAASSLRITYEGAQKTMVIGGTTASQLELLFNARHSGTAGTLYESLNYCKNNSGARLLRTELLQPSTSIATINSRLDVVTELTSNEDMFTELGKVLSRFTDLDKIVRSMITLPKLASTKTDESLVTLVIQLKGTLEHVPQLRAALEPAHSQLLTAFRDGLQDPRFAAMLEKLDGVVTGNTSKVSHLLKSIQQKTQLIKDGVHYRLDILRTMYAEVVDDIQQYVADLQDEYNLAFTAQYSAQRRWHIQVPWPRSDAEPELPSGVFEKVQFNGKGAKRYALMTTSNLRKFNSRIQENLAEIYQITNMLVNNTMDEARTQVGCLYKLADTVATVDMLRSFAEVVTLGGGAYCRPTFGDSLALQQGRHPVLHKLSPESTVPNDTFLDPLESNLHVIQGPNMSGKSIYLKQVALSQILAQVGSFVPAVSAKVRICDQIFTRLGTEDCDATSVSTFQSECAEINYILQNSQPTSLILLDEVGRATSPQEGTGMGHALCEYLALNSGVFTLMATHFHELTRLKEYKNIDVFHLQVRHSSAKSSASAAAAAADGDDDEEAKLIFTHSLQPGPLSGRNLHGGLTLARLSTLPDAVVGRAEQLAVVLDKYDLDHQAPATVEIKRHQLIHNVLTQSKHLNEVPNLEAGVIKIMLEQMQANHRESIAELHAAAAAISATLQRSKRSSPAPSSSASATSPLSSE